MLASKTQRALQEKQTIHGLFDSEKSITARLGSMCIEL